MTPALEIRNLTCGYAGRAVLSGVSFTLGPGRALMLLGPNGAGKSTLFKTMLGLLPRMGGEVFVAGEEVGGWTRKRFAREVAYVPQTYDGAFGFTVREMVLMGRTPFLEGLASPGREDERVACETIDDLGISALADRDCATLSGGERQMVLIARALAQRPRLLVMDEPFANLDLGNQALLLRRVRTLVCDGLSVVITSHDPSHAFALDGDVVCVGEGTGRELGPARTALDAEALSALYGVEIGVGAVRSRGGAVALACAPFLDEEVPHGGTE